MTQLTQGTFTECLHDSPLLFMSEIGITAYKKVNKYRYNNAQCDVMLMHFSALLRALCRITFLPVTHLFGGHMDVNH